MTLDDHRRNVRFLFPIEVSDESFERFVQTGTVWERVLYRPMYDTTWGMINQTDRKQAMLESRHEYIEKAGETYQEYFCWGLWFLQKSFKVHSKG